MNPQSLADLATPAALAELALLAGCLLLAWGVVSLLRRARDARANGAGRDGNRDYSNSITLGARGVDGVLFPALALGAALLARWVMRDALQGALPMALFQVAVPVLTSLLVIRIAVRVLRAAFPQFRAVRILERSLSWLVWGALVLWLTGWLPLMLAEMEAVTWKLGGAPVSLRSLVEGALSAAAVLVGALWISAAIETRLLAGAQRSANDLSLRKMAANATRAGLLLVGLLLALSAAGIPLGALGVLGGALGVGIGFGLQKLAANYVSGFVILAERSLRMGDMVRVDGFEGRITDIHTRYTVIRALNGRESIVPNELLITQRVENHSLADPRVMLSTRVTVAYGTDLEALKPQLEAVMAAVPRVLADPPPSMQLAAFGADGLELTLPFWIADPAAGGGNVISEVNFAVLRCLQAQAVEIPFPQRVLHRAPRPPQP